MSVCILTYIAGLYNWIYHMLHMQARSACLENSSTLLENRNKIPLTEQTTVITYTHVLI